jgi:integrase
VFPRKADAEAWLRSVEHTKATGEYVDRHAGRVTVQEWCESWRAIQAHRDSTRAQVESYFRLHLYPVLGERQLRSLRRSDVQAWVAGLSEKLAPGSVELVYRHFASAMKAAVGDRVLGRSPCERISLPRSTAVEVVPPTVEVVERIADAIAPRYRGAVVLGAGAGLRLGEVFGLRLDRVDFLRRTVRVDAQLVTPNRGAAMLAPPKTPSSVRTVPVAGVVLDELAEHVRRFPGDDGYVFTTELGAPVRRSTFHSAWARALRDAGVSGVRFHDLRHHFASVLISAGCSVTATQKALGHASATETLNTYAHLWPEDDDRTRAAIESAWTTPRCAQSVHRTVPQE